MVGKTMFFSMALLFLVSNTLHSATPVQVHGALAVSGNRIVGSKDNKPVQVAGMSHYWSIWGGEKYYTGKVTDWLVKDWNITLIRAAMAVEPNSQSSKGYLADPQYQTNLVKAVVDAAIANGIYVIVDWHDHNANRNVDNAKSFFREMAKAYANSPNVIWEIWNEPDDKNGTGTNEFDTWDDIKMYAGQVIPAIREHSSNLVVVGTPNWSQHVDVAAESPLAGPNIAYTLHFYAGTHKSELRSRAETALKKGIALFITEFGLTIADGGNQDKTVYTSETETWLDWAGRNGISWANWSIVNHAEASAALSSNASASGNWSGGDVSESGKWVRDRLRARPVYGPASVVDVPAVPGKVEAENCLYRSIELKTESTKDAGGGMNLSDSRPGSWTEYTIKSSASGSYAAELRAACASSGGTVTMKIGGNSATSWNVAATGGWQSWKTIEGANTFQLPEGVSTVRIEWGCQTNLNWIQFRKETSAAGKPANASPPPTRSPAIRAGSAFFHAPADVKKVTVFTLTGDVSCVSPGNAGLIRLPPGKGVRLLRVECRTGTAYSIPVVNY